MWAFTIWSCTSKTSKASGAASLQQVEGPKGSGDVLFERIASCADDAFAALPFAFFTFSSQFSDPFSSQFSDPFFRKGIAFLNPFHVMSQVPLSVGTF